MWQCLAQAMGDGYWQRVRCLAAAAGCVEAPDPQFQKLVTERIAAGNPEREDSPTYLLKRLKQLEQENAALRQKKRRDAAAELKDLVTSSSTSRARQTFRRSVPRHSSGSAR